MFFDIQERKGESREKNMLFADRCILFRSAAHANRAFHSPVAYLAWRIGKIDHTIRSAFSAMAKMGVIGSGLHIGWCNLLLRVSRISGFQSVWTIVGDIILGHIPRHWENTSLLEEIPRQKDLVFYR